MASRVEVTWGLHHCEQTQTDTIESIIFPNFIAGGNNQHNSNCRAINDKGTVFINTWVYSKKDTLDVHTGWWSLVNCWREGSYETLYNVLMNINQMAVGLTAGWSDGSALLANRCINVIPRHPSFLQRRGIACM